MRDGTWYRASCSKCSLRGLVHEMEKLLFEEQHRNVQVGALFHRVPCDGVVKYERG